MYEQIDMLQQGALVLIVSGVALAIPAMLDKLNRTVQDGLLFMAFTAVILGGVSAATSLVMLGML